MTLDRWPAPPAPRWVDTPATMTLRPRALARRRELLIAASAVFADRGYRGASLPAIATASGASNGALYHHFASKQALAEALVDEVFASWDDIVERIDRLELDPLQTLLVYYDAYTARLMFDISARAALRIIRDDIGRDLARSWTAQSHRTVETLLVTARTDGFVREHIDPAWLSRHILATTTGNHQLAEDSPAGPSLRRRMDDTWAGLLPAITTTTWLTAWQSSGWSTRPEPDPRRYHRHDSTVPRTSEAEEDGKKYGAPPAQKA